MKEHMVVGMGQAKHVLADSTEKLEKVKDSLLSFEAQKDMVNDALAAKPNDEAI